MEVTASRGLQKALALALLASLLPMSPARALIDEIVHVKPDETYTWQGERMMGTNQNYFSNWGPNPVLPSRTCNKEATTYCEVLLVKIHNPLSEEELDAGKKTKKANVRLRIEWPETEHVYDNTGREPTDFDLVVYASDEFGKNHGELVVSDAGNTTAEDVRLVIETTVEQASVWVLVHVVYYQVPNTNGYDGHIRVTQSR